MADTHTRGRVESKWLHSASPNAVVASIKKIFPPGHKAGDADDSGSTN